MAETQNKCTVSHTIYPHTSLKKCQLALREIFEVIQQKPADMVAIVFRKLQQLATKNKAAFLVLQALKQCRHNAKNVRQQKGWKVLSLSEGTVHISLGKGQCAKRIEPRAKGSSNTRNNYKAYVSVSITNTVVEQRSIDNINQEVANGTKS
jgi:ribosomal protein L22